VVKPWQSGQSLECQRDLLKHCADQGIPINKPFCDLEPWMQKFVIEGELREGSTLNELWEAGGWYGVKGLFPVAGNQDLQDARARFSFPLSRLQNLPDLPRRALSARDAPLPSRREHEGQKALTLARNQPPSAHPGPRFFRSAPLPSDDDAAEQLRDGILARLTYLLEVGLGYLTLDRATRTLSGGEIQRVNLTSCLGNSLVNTLFVLDEPSIGLHPRDMGQLVGVMKRLRDRGNTVLVVEHEEAVMREADHLLELGPGRGAAGGGIVFPAISKRCWPQGIRSPALISTKRKRFRFPKNGARPIRRFSFSSSELRPTICATSTSRCLWECSSASAA
jgi:excinuclease ABC subunit A